MRTSCILYATREGHTRKVAQHLASALRLHGFRAEVQNIRDIGNPTRLATYSVVVLAASVHGGNHEAEMLKFVKEHRNELNMIPTVFLSVSLSEAGAERLDTTPEQHAQFVADVERMLATFFEEAGWRPTHVKPVAGALLYSKYNFLLRFVMKRIAKKSSGDTDTSRDYEYTDWIALDNFAAELAEEMKSGADDSAISRSHVAI